MSQAEFDFEARREERKQASAAMIERIKKLLRLGADQRGNAHEAERAMQLAFELAEKHRVDVASLDLGLDDAAERLIHERWTTGERFDRLRRGVFSLLQTYFHVTVCLSKPEMIVIGKPTDVLLARYVHDFLLRAGRDCLRTYEREEKAARRRMTTNKRAGYLTGFIYGVAAMLRRARQTLVLTESQTALVVAEDAARARLLAELVPHRAGVSALTEGRKNRTAMEAGYAQGRATTINQPLEGSGRATLLLE